MMGVGHGVGTGMTAMSQRHSEFMCEALFFSRILPKRIPKRGEPRKVLPFQAWVLEKQKWGPCHQADGPVLQHNFPIPTLVLRVTRCFSSAQSSTEVMDREPASFIYLLIFKEIYWRTKTLREASTVHGRTCFLGLNVPFGAEAVGGVSPGPRLGAPVTSMPVGDMSRGFCRFVQCSLVSVPLIFWLIKLRLVVSFAEKNKREIQPRGFLWKGEETSTKWKGMGSRISVRISYKDYHHISGFLTVLGAF